MDDGDILCHPISVPSHLQEFDVANTKVGAERNPQKTEGIHFVTDLDAAPLEWRIGDVQNMAKVSKVTAGRCHTRAPTSSQPRWTQTEFALLRESLGVSRINHILRVHGPHNPARTASCRNLR